MILSMANKEECQCKIRDITISDNVGQSYLLQIKINISEWYKKYKQYIPLLKQDITDY